MDEQPQLADEQPQPPGVQLADEERALAQKKRSSLHAAEVKAQAAATQPKPKAASMREEL